MFSIEVTTFARPYKVTINIDPLWEIFVVYSLIFNNFLQPFIGKLRQIWAKKSQAGRKIILNGTMT